MAPKKHPRTLAELEAENARLKAELEQMRMASSLALGSGLQLSGQRTSSIPAGVEEMILQVDGRDRVVFANPPFATLIGLGDRKQMLGQPLGGFDKTVLGEGLLGALVAVARSRPGVHVVERVCPSLPIANLPNPKAKRPSSDPVLRFTAHTVKGHAQLVVQDVTRLRWLEQTFSRYVPAKVIEQMASMPAGQFLTMERRDVTVLFADLRGFTKISQDAELEEVQDMISTFLTGMVECIELLDGTVDKFAGDEVMALFGAPIRQADHSLRALICAVEMQKSHARWLRDRRSEKRLVAELGIGLASGVAIVGNTGTRTRMEYTALGHTVNLAGRLCGSASGGEILTTPETHTAALAAGPKYSGRLEVPHLSFRRRGALTFKNVSEPVEAISVVLRDSQWDDVISHG
jgi:class 3 adenylate cyclase